MHGVEWGKIRRLPQRITYHYSPEPSQATAEKTLQPSSKKPSASQNRKPPILKCLKKVGTPGGGYHDEMGGRWSVAWRVLDAQHWGVPQRRRRIALVADFGGDTAWEILFERQSMSGYPAESGAEGERSSADAESGAGGAGKDAGSVICLQGNAIDRADTAGCNGKGWKEDVCYTLNTIDRPAVCSGFKLGNSEQTRSIGYAEEQAPTLNAECGGNKPAVMCLNDQGGNVMGVSHDVAGTLRAQEHGHQPAVMAFDTTQITSKQNGSIPDFGKPCHTLNANAHVPCAVLDMSHACDVIRDCGEVAPSLQARMGTGGNQIPLTYQKTTGTLSPGAHAGSYNGQDAYNDMLVVSSEISPALRGKANDPYRTDMAAYVASVDCRNFTEGGEINGTLQAKESEGQSLNLNNTVRQNMVVRRLTPLECERLQGFPDGWTDIGDWVKTDKRGRKIKVKGSADSPRYKALGNSIALPPWKWLLKRLCGNYERNATMASLFDGIGGFPLIWEQLNGRGTCLWASEIEEFPIAVTKRRFGTLEEPGDMGRFLFPCGNERSGT
nr:MAG TPA: Cytosine specific methyltransferase [Caudoviricetes sp.]